MQAVPDPIDPIKQRMKAIWTAGDFGQIARYSARIAEAFVNRIGIAPGSTVLDVACGTGNVSIPAARIGANVTGVDIAPNLLEQARERAADEGLGVVFAEGDAEQLSYPDASFDVVASMWGAMFAPRPERVAAELIRVCRSGGKIAMANWPRAGFVGETFALGARYVPPPEGVPSPLLWGDAGTAKARLAHGIAEITTTVQHISMEFPFEPVEVARFFREYFGPMRVTFARLDAAGQADYSAALERLWQEHNEASAGGTKVAAQYLEVTAIRA
jgi:2-polyprenyl-3-methyl-5-hydroxy-6-metoxy-1,4-benzoquinol methylase